MNSVLLDYLHNEFVCSVYLTYDDYIKYKSKAPINEVLAVDDGIYFYRFMSKLINLNYYYIFLYHIKDLMEVGFTEDFTNENSNIVMYRQYNIILPSPLLILTINEMEFFKYE